MEQVFWIAALAVVCFVTFRVMNRGSHGHGACESEKGNPVTLVRIERGRVRRKVKR